MNRQGKTRNGIIACGVIAALIALLAIVVAGGEKNLPTPPAAQASEPIVAPVMYVTPGDEGQTTGGDEGDTDSDATNDKETQEKQQDDAVQSLLGSVLGPGAVVAGSGSAGGSSSGTSSPNPDGPSSSPSARDEVIPGISTNLGTYTTISAVTKAPERFGFTRGALSGLDSSVDLLWFYAIPDNTAGKDYSVLVEYSNTATGGLTRTLQGNNGMFALPIIRSDGEKTQVTLTLVNENGARTDRTATYVVNYVGRQGPTITVNITEGQRIVTSPATLIVSARDADGKIIYADHLEVRLTGPDGTSRVLTDHTTSDPYEYVLDLERFNLTGDDNQFNIEVKATDYSGEKASTTVSRNFIFEHHAYGEKIGEATVIIDASVVGLGRVATFQIDLHKGYPFAQDLVEGLTNNGLAANYKGSFKSDFYLAGVTSGGLFAGQAIPDTLVHKVQQDQLTWTGTHNSDSLTEHDWTMDSGWLYCVNNSYWPPTNFSGFVANPGDTISIIFSVGLGKDIGHATGGAGALASYCGNWVGGYTEQHTISQYEVTEESTCGAPGKARYVCAVPGCGAWGSVTGAHADETYIEVPATGNHSWAIDVWNSEEPSAGHDGHRHYVCSVCGAEKDEPWPYEGGDNPDPENPDPEDPDPEDPDPENPNPENPDPEITNQMLEGQAEQDARVSEFVFTAFFTAQSAYEERGVVR